MSPPKRKFRSTPVWKGDKSQTGNQNGIEGWTLVHNNIKMGTAQDELVLNGNCFKKSMYKRVQ